MHLMVVAARENILDVFVRCFSLILWQPYESHHFEGIFDFLQLRANPIVLLQRWNAQGGLCGNVAAYNCWDWLVGDDERARSMDVFLLKTFLLFLVLQRLQVCTRRLLVPHAPIGHLRLVFDGLFAGGVLLRYHF